MHLVLHDSAYTDRLAAFLQNLGQPAVVHGRDRVELGDDEGNACPEIATWLRVWHVVYPDADVELDAD